MEDVVKDVEKMPFFVRWAVILVLIMFLGIEILRDAVWMLKKSMTRRV